MANSVDTLLQGLRDAGTGVRAGVDAYQTQEKLQLERDDRLAKKEAEEAALARRAGWSKQLTPLEEAIAAEDFDYQSWPKLSTDLRAEIMASGDDKAIAHLRYLDTAVNQRRQADLTDERARGTEARAKKKDDRDATKDAIDLQFKIQDRYDNDDVTKQTNTIRQSFSKLDKAFESKPSGARDMGIVYHYMKLLDPPSVVREAEFKTAAEMRSFFNRVATKNEDGTYTTKAGGVTLPSFLVQAFQKTDEELEGSFLLPGQLEAFQREAENSYRAQLETQRSVDERTLGQIKDGGLEARRKSIINRTADDDLKALDEKAAARKKKAEERKKKGEIEQGVDGEEPFQEIAMSAYGAKGGLREQLAPAFMQQVQAINDKRAAENKPPLTPGEKNAMELEWLKRKKIKVIKGK